MKQGVYTVSSNEPVAASGSVWRMRLQGDTSALERPGQFVDVALEGRFLRRPFAARAWDSSGFDIIYKVVGDGTAAMTSLRPGALVDCLVGLGNGFSMPPAGARRVLVAAGGIGASPLFSQTVALARGGYDVTVVLGFNTADEIILLDEYKSLGVNVPVTTVDGSYGIPGFVTAAFSYTTRVTRVCTNFDYVYACGPRVMMKAVCESVDCPGQVSLEERMGCGCGICYGCTCQTSDGPRRVCADGPVFDKEKVVW